MHFANISQLVFPAPAGVIPTLALAGEIVTRFPRTCGGDPAATKEQIEYDDVFPAPAGVILRRPTAISVSVSFPRTCGGDPKRIKSVFSCKRFSPHLRG